MQYVCECEIVVKAVMVTGSGSYTTDHFGSLQRLDTSREYVKLRSVKARSFPMIPVNTLRPRQNSGHFPDDIIKCIFLKENGRISIKISLEFVPNVPINNIPALVQVMAWRRPGDKPLSEPLVARLSTHICVTRPQWVNSLAIYHFGYIMISLSNTLIMGFWNISVALSKYALGHCASMTINQV